MPYGYTPPAWLNNTQPTPSTGGNRPPTERVWEEDRRDEPTVSVDYTPPVDTSQPIRDVAAERDAIDDAAAMALPTLDIYTPPEEIYEWLPGGDPLEQSDWINVSQVGGGPNSPGSALYGINLEDYGFSNKEEFLPRDFLQSIMEGSIVSGNEYIESLYPQEGGPAGMTLGEAASVPGIVNLGGLPETNIGTWGMVEEGTHPLFPGGLDDYYDMQNENWGAINDPWDSWTDPWYGGHKQSVGPAGMTLAELARHTWFSESLADVERREQERLEEGLDVATMSDMEDIFGEEFGGGANPLFDPEFSESATAEMNPLYADITLFEQARS